MKKKAKKAHKYLRPEEVEELSRSSTQDLLKEYMTQSKALREIKRKKKDDSSIRKLKEDIKLHRDTTVSDKVRAELKQLKDRAKELKAEIDEGIEAQLDELKELNRDYREEAGHPNEKSRLIQAIIDARG